MKFTVKSIRSVLMMAGTLLLLVSCGGGSQIETFAPVRIVAFGDESSRIESDGRKHSINGVKFEITGLPKAPTEVDCTVNPIWVQQLAASYAMSFPGCPVPGYAAVALMNAEVAADSARLTVQIDTFLASNTFGPRDLVTVLVGVHDIINAYENQPDQASALVAVEAAARNVGAQVVRMTQLGAKVLVATVPDVGLMPYGYAAVAGGQARLMQLSTRFNTTLRLKLNDVRDGGRSAGLITVDQLIELAYREPAAYLLTNLADGACTVALPGCNQADHMVPLASGVAGGFGSTYLWADDRHMSASMQARVGYTAVIRAHNNPF